MFEGEARRQDAVPLLGETRGQNDRKRRDEDHPDQQSREEPYDDTTGP
jgi:hypothetical protein